MTPAGGATVYGYVGTFWICRLSRIPRSGDRSQDLRNKLRCTVTHFGYPCCERVMTKLFIKKNSKCFLCTVVSGLASHINQSLRIIWHLECVPGLWEHCQKVEGNEVPCWSRRLRSALLTASITRQTGYAHHITNVMVHLMSRTFR